ncbi:MAG TPA: hypothetical protein VGM86_02200 [Thermoanaerobaculia bacterium]
MLPGLQCLPQLAGVRQRLAGGQEVAEALLHVLGAEGFRPLLQPDEPLALPEPLPAPGLDGAGPGTLVQDGERRVRFVGHDADLQDVRLGAGLRRHRGNR